MFVCACDLSFVDSATNPARLTLSSSNRGKECGSSTVLVFLCVGGVAGP